MTWSPFQIQGMLVQNMQEIYYPYLNYVNFNSHTITLIYQDI